MKYSIEYTSHFKKKVKLLKKRGYDLTELAKTINILCETGELPREFKPHKLSGKYSGCLECHIKPDWLLVWEQYDDRLVMLMVDTGTHSDIF
ncbi:MAG: type II toxin-antitoxin system YafQ family toxin [Paludibacteraceae bacterium]|nr:type II toxin-antitoxin system YafQ family toxin [Paludibacteraceae bacterium]MBP5480781.1 type II toxin-antitoxin system YafQ family toxin [Paludibacteraceae bacterium]